MQGPRDSIKLDDVWIVPQWRPNEPLGWRVSTINRFRMASRTLKSIRVRSTLADPNNLVRSSARERRVLLRRTEVRLGWLCASMHIRRFSQKRRLHSLMNGKKERGRKREHKEWPNCTQRTLEPQCTPKQMPTAASGVRRRILDIGESCAVSNTRRFEHSTKSVTALCRHLIDFSAVDLLKVALL